MATPAQIAANRLNARKSTGPRPSEGKANSRFNALKRGIDAQSIVLPGEDPAAYHDLAQSNYDSLRPITPEEQFLVEADLYRALLAESPGASLASVLLSDSPTVRVLLRIQKQIAAFERAGPAPKLRSTAIAPRPKPSMPIPPATPTLNYNYDRAALHHRPHLGHPRPAARPRPRRTPWLRPHRSRRRYRRA